MFPSVLGIPPIFISGSGDAVGGKKLEGLGLKMVRQLSNGEIANQKVRYQMGSIKIHTWSKQWTPFSGIKSIKQVFDT